jgi:hypothetical protein
MSSSPIRSISIFLFNAELLGFGPDGRVHFLALGASGINRHQFFHKSRGIQCATNCRSDVLSQAAMEGRKFDFFMGERQ